MHELIVTEQNFEQEVLGAAVPAMVDFWAPWCGPCRVMGPIVEALATDFAGKAVIGKLNVDDHGALAQKYNVMSIPTILFFKDGKLVDEQVGSTEKEILVEKLSKLL